MWTDIDVRENSSRAEKKRLLLNYWLLSIFSWFTTNLLSSLFRHACSIKKDKDA